MAKSNSKTKISIIVLAINSLKLIKDTLLDVSKLDLNGLECECIIVDNGSTDGIETELKSFKFKNMSFKFIRSEVNLGFAGGNNLGIKHALSNRSDYVLLLNNDMIIESDLLTKLIAFLEDHPRAGLVSPKIYFAKGYEFHKDRYKPTDLGKVFWYAGGKVDWNNIYTSHIGVDEVDRGQLDKVSKTDIASGACALIKVEVFEKIGLFDEGFFLYWEDSDLSRKAINAGFEVYYYPKVRVWHKVSASAGGIGSRSNDYFLVRNRLYFALRYARIRTKVAVLKDTLKLAFVGREWQKLGALHALIGKKGAGPWIKK